MNGLSFPSQMRWAWALMSLYLLSLFLLRLIRPTEPNDVKIVLIGTALLNPGILLFLIRLVRGTNKDVREVVPSTSQLSTWGWFWRAFVLYFAQVPILFFVTRILSLNVNVSQFSAAGLLIWEVPFTLVSMVGAWALFSRDRMGKIRVFAAAVRGY